MELAHDSTAVDYIGILLVLSVVYYIQHILRCIFFHPLAKYPGPFLSKFSSWTSFYNTYMGDRHVWLWQCHERFGPIVRKSPNSVTFCTPEAFRSIYETNANVRKARQYRIWPKDSAEVNTFACIDKMKHARRRRVLNSAISENAIKSAEPYVIQHVDRWADLLAGSSRNTWSQSRNMSTWSNKLVFDILCDLCFGKSFEIKEAGPNKLKSLPQSISKFMEFSYNIFHSPFVDLWLWMKPHGPNRLLSAITPREISEYMVFVKDNLDERMRQERDHEKQGANQTRKDMLYYLFHAKDPETGGPGYTPVELYEDTDMLTVAGSDTTSGVCAAMFFYLASNPTVLQKLEREIRSNFKNIDEVKTGVRLLSCTYLWAVINETLRMSPPGAGDMLREVLPGGLKIGGTDEIIPPGIIVASPIWALHHDSEIFPQPFHFQPERWIAKESDGGVSEENIKRGEEAFFHFLMGIRGCPGRNLARMELSVIFARLLFLYEFRREPGSTTGEGNSAMGWGRRQKTQFQTKDAFAALRDGPYLQFRARTT